MPKPDAPGSRPTPAPYPTRRPPLLTLRRSFWGALSLASWSVYRLTLRRILPLDLALRPTPHAHARAEIALETEAYRIGTLAGQTFLDCRTCGRRSFLRADVENLYCPRCDRHLGDPDAQLVEDLAAQASGRDSLA